MPPQIIIEPPSTTTTTTSTTALIPSPTTTSQTSTTTTTAATSTTTSSSRTTSTSSSTSTTAATSTTPAIATTSTTNPTPGNVVTSTSTMFVTTASRNVVGPTNSVSSGGGSTSFLQNTGAVAGVFTVVGLIGLSLIFVLARNFHRRRQQEAFDRELQEATRQAAATTTGPFFDDDDDNPYKGSYGAYPSGERQFSDMSHGTHGTYSQPPLAADAYGMREISHSPGPGDMLYSSDLYAAGAAGIGVARARSMRVEGSKAQQPDFAAALKDGNAPYPAFAAPNPGHMPGGVADPYASAMAGNGMDMLSMGTLAMAHSQQSYPQQQSYSQGSLDRKRSIDGAGQPYRASGYGPPLPAKPMPMPANRYSVVNEDMEDPYGGFEEDGDEHKEVSPAPLPNPFERNMSEESHAKQTEAESMYSGQDSQEEPKRVLKVANE